MTKWNTPSDNNNAGPLKPAFCVQVNGHSLKQLGGIHFAL